MVSQTVMIYTSLLAGVVTQKQMAMGALGAKLLDSVSMNVKLKGKFPNMLYFPLGL
jgi:hypothetical protein